MASANQSPVMVEQPSSPPSHPYTNPDYALSISSTTISNQRAAPAASNSMPESEGQRESPQEQSQPQPQAQRQTPEQSSERSGSPAPAEQTTTTEITNDGDDSSNSESNSDSSTSTETAGTISTPRSSAQDSGHPIPDSSSTQLETHDQDQPPIEDNTNAESQPETTSPDADRPSDETSIPPPPVDPDPPFVESIPSWVTYEEDTTVPDEQELKEIEANKTELSAEDTNAVEKEVFTDLEDPDLRPSKKIRLSWVVKGVRGTRERPNRARIMTSPSVCVDGNYWNIKFFPRGNKSRNHLCVHVRCSPAEPLVGDENLVGSFKCYEGAPDTDLSKVEPTTVMELQLPDVKEAEPLSTETEPTKGEGEQSQEHVPRGEQEEEDDDDDDDSVSGDEGDIPDGSPSIITAEDYRVSAQIGFAIYNPAEPRTCYTSSVSHQFYPHQDDWGNETAVNQWEDIHRRKHGQRQALLRDDTLAVDAYIRIYDDPTKALFWHDAPGERQWDSKGLAGFFPFGTRPLTHSPATAGIAAWMLLTPFRSALQKVDAGLWRKDSSARPRPLIAHLQLMLFQMRCMKKEELYIRLDNVIHEIQRSGESFDNVNVFWEIFRRAIEIETEGDGCTRESLLEILGSREQIRSLPNLPVQDVANFQESANAAFEKAKFKSALPNFLPLTLQRQSFDAEKRQWQLHLNRVRISEELDLSQFCTDETAKYTLYGFIIHDGDRTSGRFYSLLRPGGPGGKWLAFSDGDGNKVFSYTKKQVEKYEGLEGHELKKAVPNRHTIHTALYVRTSRLPDYLQDHLDPYHLPFWLKPHLDECYHHNPDLFGEPDDLDKEKSIPVELFWDKSVGGQEGKLDLYKLKCDEKARQKQYRQVLTSDRDASIADIKAKIAAVLEVDQKAFRLWAMNHHKLGGVSKGYMHVLPDDSIVRSCLYTSLHLTLWFTMVPETHELAEDALATNFLKLGDIHVEAPPKPESPVIEDVPALPTEAGTVPDGPDVHVSENATQPVSTADQTAMPDVEQSSIQEAVAQTVEASSNTESTPVTNTAEQATESTPNNRESSSQTETLAAADEEQASVRMAVERDVHGDSSRHNSPTAQVTEVEPSENASQGRASISDDVAPVEAVNTSEAQVTTVTDLPVDSSQATTPEDGVVDLVPEHAIAVPPSATQVADLPVTPTEAITNPTSLEISVAEPSNANGDDSDVPPVVHGHLFEASSHPGAPLSPTESRNEPPLNHGEPPLPVGIPIAVGDDQIILVQPNQEDISPEDAALISSMIAADLEAAERSQRNGVNADNGEEEADSGEDPIVESRPVTPRQNVPLIYGFLHVFDAKSQKFTAHGTFMVPRHTTISSMVRKQMEYDEEKKFHLWKRDGTYRTVGVSLESTFQDVSLSDCCEVIVGDHLGEAKIEALKAEAKYVDPGQLMRYLAMVQRGHPITALTSETAIEIAEFGGDYYKGPMVHGQRHGKSCNVITQAGDRYEGALVAGQKSGEKGKMIYQNGDVYDGGWLDDQKHGQGEFVEKRTGNRYVGGYENDKRWGKGVTYWEQADQQAALCQVCYFEEVDALFYKCGHVVACYACARQCASESNGCPVCRKPIEAVVKMYRS